MSQSPLTPTAAPPDAAGYFGAFEELARRIRSGASFSGRERNCAFLNLGGDGFGDVSAALGLDLAQDGRGLAITDWDHDGDLDLWFTNRTAPRLQLLVNRRAASGRQSLALLLVGDPGQGSPRDAAAARATLAVPGAPTKTATVHLGDGFLSQSSRWLHFGLGTPAPGTTCTATVAWPGGGSDTFAGLLPGRRYILAQGSPQAQLAPPTRQELEPNASPLPDPDTAARAWLAERAPVPPDALPVSLPDGAILLNLWATWCAPCRTELELLGAADLGAVTVWPMNVERASPPGVSPTPPPDLDATAAQVLASAGLAGRGGFARPDLVASLDAIVRERIYRHRSLPLPASFLLDSDRRVAAVYMGAVDVGLLQRDVAQLAAPRQLWRELAAPIPGRHAAALFITHPVAVAASLLEAGAVDEAEEYLLRHRESIDTSTQDGRRQLADVEVKLGEIDRAREAFAPAADHFARAATANPQLIAAQVLHALSLARAGQVEPALDAAWQLRSRFQGNANFINLEADVLRLAGRDAAAASLYNEVLERNPRYIPALVELARLLATSSDPAARNPPRALEIAQLLMSAPGAGSNSEFLSVTAHAAAAAGQSATAASLARRALAAALPYADDDSLATLRADVDRFSKQRE